MTQGAYFGLTKYINVVLGLCDRWALVYIHPPPDVKPTWHLQDGVWGRGGCDLHQTHTLCDVQHTRYTAVS
jgi:hypothetical protein